MSILKLLTFLFFLLNQSIVLDNQELIDLVQKNLLKISKFKFSFNSLDNQDEKNEKFKNSNSSQSFYEFKSLRKKLIIGFSIPI